MCSGGEEERSIFTGVTCGEATPSLLANASSGTEAAISVAIRDEYAIGVTGSERASTWC